MTRKRSSLFVLLVLYSAFSFAQTEMSYEGFLNTIMENNPMIARARNVREKGNLMYRSAQGGYDPLISAEYDNKHFDGKNYYSALLTKIKQPLFTSQYITTGYEYGGGYYLNPDLKTPTYGLPYIGVEASLLQGMLIDKRRAEVLKSKGYMGYYEAEQNVQINDMLYVASLSYFDWVYSCKELNLQYYFMQLAEQRYSGIKDLANIGERAGVDTIEASMILKTRALDVKSSTIDYQKRQVALLSLRWTSRNEPSKAGTSLILRDSLDRVFERVQARYLSSFENVNIGNPVLKKYESNREILNVDRRYKAELIKPKLDVKYNFLFNTLTDNSPALNIANYRWSANLSFPLLMRTARNDYKVAKLEVLNNQIELDNKKNELTFKIDLTKQNISVLTEQIANAESNLDYSKRLLGAEKMKFEAGESSLFLLNTREAKVLESELKLAEYKLKFIKNYLEFIYLRGNIDYVI